MDPNKYSTPSYGSSRLSLWIPHDTRIQKAMNLAHYASLLQEGLLMIMGQAWHDVFAYVDSTVDQPLGRVVGRCGWYRLGSSVWSHLLEPRNYSM